MEDALPIMELPCLSHLLADRTAIYNLQSKLQALHPVSPHNNIAQVALVSMYILQFTSIAPESLKPDWVLSLVQ